MRVVWAVVHGGDFVSAGTGEAQAYLAGALSANLDICGVGSVRQGLVTRRSSSSGSSRGTPRVSVGRLAPSTLSASWVQGRARLGPKAWVRSCAEDLRPELGGQAAGAPGGQRRGVATYLAVGRPDIQITVRCILAGTSMSSARLTHLERFLRDCAQIERHFGYQDAPSEVTVDGDASMAAAETVIKSSTGMVTFMSPYRLKTTTATTQSALAASTGEAYNSNLDLKAAGVALHLATVF